VHRASPSSATPRQLDRLTDGLGEVQQAAGAGAPPVLGLWTGASGTSAG
jgi:hypothetical protein